VACCVSAAALPLDLLQPTPAPAAPRADARLVRTHQADVAFTQRSGGVKARLGRLGEGRSTDRASHTWSPSHALSATRVSLLPLHFTLLCAALL
jgi:hypothetical protein